MSVRSETIVTGSLEEQNDRDKDDSNNLDVLEQSERIDSQVLPTISGQYIVTPVPESFADPKYSNRSIVEFTRDEDAWNEFKSEFESLDIHVSETHGGKPRFNSLESASEKYSAFPVLQPEIDRISSFDELNDLNSEMEEIFMGNVEVSGLTLYQIADTEKYIRSLVNQIEAESAAQIFDPLLRTDLNPMSTRVSEVRKEKKDRFHEADRLFQSLDKTGVKRFSEHIEVGDSGTNIDRLTSALAGELSDPISEEFRKLLETKPEERYNDLLTTLTDFEEVSESQENEILIEAVETIEDEIWAGIGDADPEYVSENAEHVATYDNLHPRFKGQILGKLAEDIADEADSKRKDVEEFGEIISSIEPELQEELYEILKTDTDKAIEESKVNKHGQKVEYSEGDDKFGNTLFDIAVNREYNFFINDEADRIEDLVEIRGDFPEIDDSSFKEESPYKQIIEELTDEESLENGEDTEYGEMSDQELAEKLRMVNGLAERIELDYDASNVFDMLAGKEHQRQINDYEPEEDEIESLLEDRRRELEKDVQNKLRDYMKQNIERVGFEAALDQYEEATGERPENLEQLDENELAALKVRSRFRGETVEMVDKLLEYQNDVYELKSNQDWLEKHGFTQEEITDPDLSNQTDERYKRPEEPEYRSELEVEIDSLDIQIDTEQEKQQYWNEIIELLDRVGVEDEVEDIDDVEQAIQDLEEPRNKKEYKELKNVVNNYHSVENRAGGIPDKLSFRVADPMDAVRMGDGFGSCMNVEDGVNAWGAPAQAIDTNKMVFYAEDEQGRERARVKAFITEDEELIYHNTSRYKDTEIDTSDYFEAYMEKVSDELGLDLKHSSQANGWRYQTELLEAHDWYSKA